MVDFQGWSKMTLKIKMTYFSSFRKMQNAKKAQRDNGATPTLLTQKNPWGPRLSILCPVPSGKALWSKLDTAFE